MAKLILFWLSVAYLFAGVCFGYQRLCCDLKKGERFWRTLGKAFLLIFLWGFGVLGFIGTVFLFSMRGSGKDDDDDCWVEEINKTKRDK